MSYLPWLLSEAAWVSPENFPYRNLSRLGELATYDWPIEEVSCSAARWLGRPCFEEWAAAVCREALLIAPKDLSRTWAILSALKDAGLPTVPFPEGPEAASLLDAPPAAVLIPLESGTRVEFCQLWVGHHPLGSENRLREGDRVGRLHGCHFRLVGAGDLDIIGRSWTLGACLAQEAIRQGGNLPALLAHHWVVSGIVSPGGLVEPVNFGAKATLTRLLPSRNWLLPAGNRSILDPAWEAAAGGRVFFARDLTTAWAQISGEGFQDGENLDWFAPPLSSPQAMHCFASKALGPLFTSLLWARPRSAVIWSSEKMMAQAEVLARAWESARMALEGFEKCEAAQIRPVDDCMLPRIRTQLLAHPNLGTGAAEPVVFNITGGNLLMRVALLDIAQLRPHIRLVYRLEGGAGVDFMHLHFPSLRPVAGAVGHSALSPSAAADWKSRLLDFGLTQQREPRQASTAESLFQAVVLPDILPSLRLKKLSEIRPPRALESIAS